MRLVTGMALVLVLLAAGPGMAAEVPPVGGGSLFVTTGADGPLQAAPVLHTDVRIRVTGLIARVEVAQRFQNPTGVWLEGLYVFPLPEGAAVDTLYLRVGERVIEGQVREREQAKQTYVQARQEGRKASLLEQERPNVFTVSVANIGPGEEVSVVLHYQELVHYDTGQFRLRVPLVVGPRYVPGTTAIPGVAGTGWGVNTPEVPDAARITPPVLHPSRGPINPVSLVVELDAGFPLRRLESPFHEVVATATSDGSHVVALRDGTVPADRDFELIWAPEVGGEPQAAAWSELHEGEHYALVMLLPPAVEATGARLPREVIYVVDTSGSMAGASIGQARLALDQALGALDRHDRFNVIEFNSTSTRLFPRSVVAGRAEVEHARRWVAGLQARGGTEMLGALRLALESDAGEEAVRQVVFVTDGQVGNEDQLFRYIHERLGRSRLFTVGIGSSPNGHFMTRAARFGRGTYTYIGSPTEVAEKMSVLFRKLEHPVLADVAVGWGGRGDVEAWPARVPDLYAGEPLVLVARLGPEPRAELRVSGRRDAEGWDAVLAADGSVAETGIHRLWARKKISGLMDRLREGADRDEVRSAVVSVALRHRLVSAYTSLVAVDVTPTRPAQSGLATGLVPTNLPAGAEYEKIFGKLPQTATPMELYLVMGLSCLAVAVAMRRWGVAMTRRLLLVAVVALAVGFLAASGRIWVKAQLAQYLLRRAWAATDVGSGPVKPWPWADTWPVARLLAPQHGVDLIVLADASGRTLAFGPGHVPGTAPPGAPGHTVLTGHRDTAFRFLRELAAGDELRLVAPGGDRRYAVVDMRVVDARDTWVLRETADDRLTLVTCYPFDALVPGGPLRYVVRAARGYSRQHSSLLKHG